MKDPFSKKVTHGSLELLKKRNHSSHFSNSNIRDRSWPGEERIRIVRRLVWLKTNSAKIEHRRFYPRFVGDYWQYRVRFKVKSKPVKCFTSWEPFVDEVCTVFRIPNRVLTKYQNQRENVAVATVTFHDSAEAHFHSFSTCKQVTFFSSCRCRLPPCHIKYSVLSSSPSSLSSCPNYVFVFPYNAIEPGDNHNKCEHDEQSMVIAIV